MKFYVKTDQKGADISLFQDEDDVNICVNGEVVAWFDASEASLVYNEKWLKEAGLTWRSADEGE
jgi:hypothetical protein